MPLVPQHSNDDDDLSRRDLLSRLAVAPWRSVSLRFPTWLTNFAEKDATPPRRLDRIGQLSIQDNRRYRINRLY